MPEAPFDEPWQAQLFALTVALNEGGTFSWSEWSEAFAPRWQETEAYWEAWSEALIALLQERGIADVDLVETLKVRWQEAARATPHGQPIALSNATGTVAMGSV